MAKWCCVVLWPFFLGLAFVSVEAAERVEFVESPFRSLSKTRQLLDAADLRILLPLGYAQQPGLRGRMSDRPGVVEHRSYVGEEGVVAVEIAIVAGVAGGYEFALCDGGGVASKTFKRVVQSFAKMVRENESRRTREPELGHEMYQLGHIEADRALALLKALGYNTVEFAASSAKKGGSPSLDLVKGKGEKLPLIIRVANASKTSLLQADASGAKSSSRTSSTSKKGVQGAPQLGGSHLHSATTGAPEERLLLVYDRSDLEALEKLVNLLQTHIDIPAQQIVIEALVIEVNTTQLHSLGVELSASKDHARGAFSSPNETGTPFSTFLFSRESFADFIAFKGSLEALAETGDAEILSSPSVLVLNDRQARIQVGRQIPIVRSTATTSTISKGIEYFPIGIVLNLRPRINRENTEVTLQIETIISSISTESAAKLEAGVSEAVEFAPIVDNRLVETYVRVADGTPFIIGGLLSTEELESKAGIPLVSRIPILGHLFSRQRIEKIQREVIVVITPHIVPLEDNSFSYLIPRDADIFNRFDYQLFRNAYRLRDDDIWDLKFVRESPVLLALLEQVEKSVGEDVLLQRKEPIERLLRGQIPGEEVLIRRMLYEVVGKLDFSREIDLEKVFVFTPPKGEHKAQLYSDDLVLSAALEPAMEEAERTLMLSYDAQPIPKPGHAFSLPLAMVKDTTVAVAEQKTLVWDMNVYDADQQPRQWSIVLANEDDVERLRRVLILKYVLDLNKNLPQTLQGFHPGVQILFPTREDMRTRYHPIDRDVARLFYETQFPYQISERKFNRAVHEIEDLLGVKIRSLGGNGQ